MEASPGCRLPIQRSSTGTRTITVYKDVVVGLAERDPCTAAILQLMISCTLLNAQQGLSVAETGAGIADPWLGFSITRSADGAQRRQSSWQTC